MATRTVTLKRVPVPLWDAVIDLALAEDRDPLTQAERLLRAGLEQAGYWPPPPAPNNSTARPDQDRAATELPEHDRHRRSISF